LRIGFVRPGDWADQIASAHENSNVEWFSLSPTIDPGSLCSRSLLDAWVCTTRMGALEVRTVEHAGKEAAWYDWAQRRPLSYPAVFPMRVDCERLTLPGMAGKLSNPPLARALIEAVATFSRQPARLSLADRVGGRRPLVNRRPTPQAVATYVPDPDGIAGLVARLCRRLGVLEDGVAVGEPEQAASRLVGALLSTALAGFDDQVRRQGLETAARITPDEPETILRLAAVRLAVHDDGGGLDALELADQMLRKGGDLLPVDQSGFLHSEVEHGCGGGSGGGGGLTLGRLAAGVCLASAVLPSHHLGYFRDDMLDDVRYSSLMLGREQDMSVLTEVFRMLESARARERLTILPASDQVTAAAASKKAKPKRRRRAA